MLLQTTNTPSVTNVTIPEGTVLVLSHWSNAYRKGDKEYFWKLCDDRATARRFAALKQKRGQPTQFTDWVKGTSKYFTSAQKFMAACASVNLIPSLNENTEIYADY